MTVGCLIGAASLTLAAASLQAATTSWVRVKHPALAGGGSNVYIRDILAAEAGEPWLAVGYLVQSDGARVPSAWSSADGTRWSRTTMNPTASTERRDGPYFVARRGSTAVALGESFDGQLRPAAWYRSAPNAWTALTSPTDPLVNFSGRIRALDTGPDRFVAIGLDMSNGRTTTYVFTSTDGSSWRVEGGIDPDEGFFPFGVSDADGKIVVVGSTTSGSSVDGRIWVLDEGEWTRVPAAPLGLDGPGAQVLLSVDWNPARGFVAGGLVVGGGREIPTLWTSRDGLAWAKLPDGTPPNDGGNAAIQRVVADGDGYVASGASDAGPRVWRSSDGASWTAVPPPPTPPAEAELVLAASSGGKLMVATLGEVGSRLHAWTGATWVRRDTGPAFPRPTGSSELADVAAVGSSVIAVGSAADERALVMVSSRGGTWQRRPFSDRAGRLLAVTSSGGRFWAAGWRLVGGRARLAVWTSKDGRVWQRAGGSALFPVGAFIDVAPVRGGVVAVALEPSRRGFVTTAWTLTRAGWRDEGILGPGEPRAVCVGPHGVTAVATRGSGLQSRVVAWTRSPSGRWPLEAELVAGGGAVAGGCADAPKNTIIVGQNGNLGATLWRRAGSGDGWRGMVLAQTDPASSVGGVMRYGKGFLATGSYGGRGQVDLMVWHSLDGVGWAWLGGLDPVFTEPGYQAGLGLERVGNRIVVVGRHGAGDAGLWVGPAPEPPSQDPTNQPGP